MTHIHKYKLPFRHRYPTALGWAIWAIVILLVVYGLWWSITSARAGYRLVTEAEARIAKAEADTQELIEVLNGRVSMVEYAGKYAVVEQVIWEVK